MTLAMKHLDHDKIINAIPSKNKSDYGSEIIRLGDMLEKIRKSKKMTQEQLAQKCGTSKTYISRIENGASEIRLSTLIRIIHQGFGGQLKLTVTIKNNLTSFNF